MSYHIFTKHIPADSIHTIFELGSRDLDDARVLIQDFPNARCYSFECNPDCLAECRKRLSTFTQDEHQRIVLVERAVSTEDTIVSFYPFDLTKYNNMGASSMLEIDFTTRNPTDPDYNRSEVQTRIDVEGTRLDTYVKNSNIARVDLLCIDLQGYELQAIKSLGEELRNVRYIVTECSIQSTYKGGSTFTELYAYLQTYGFEYVVSYGACGFGNKFPDLNMKGFSEFDALFVNRGGSTLKENTN